MVNINSRYSDAQNLFWMRGNLHVHTTNSDGPCSPQDTLDAYAARGYDFLALSDHDQVSSLAGLDSRGMTLLSANEITANGPHMLHIGAQTALAPSPDRQQVLNAAHLEGGLVISCHPNWEKHFDHCPLETLERWTGYCGIELFNAVADRQEGAALATDKWDRLLSKGRCVWGFAHDDCHSEEDFGMAWNMVQTASREPEALLSALAAGHFYASTGVFIDTLRVVGSSIYLAAAGAERIIAVGDWGKRIGMVDGNEYCLHVPEDITCTYLRFECIGKGGRKAWTQPFFMEHGACAPKSV